MRAHRPADEEDFPRGGGATTGGAGGGEGASRPKRQKPRAIALERFDEEACSPIYCATRNKKI